DLALDHEDHARVAQSGVRADDLEQVGEAGRGGALVRRHAGLGPDVPEGASLTALDVVGDRLVGGEEPGRDDQDVDLALGPVTGDDPGRGDLGDAVSDHLD